MTTYLGKSCSFCLPRVPFVNCRQFMYLVISLLVLRAGYGIWLYQFLIIAYLFTLTNKFDPTVWPTNIHIHTNISLSVTGKIRVTSWENLFLSYANNKGADQPAHPRSLISTCVFRCLDSIISLVSIFEISNLWVASVAAHAGLSLTTSKTPKTGFLVTRINCSGSHCWFFNWTGKRDIVWPRASFSR